MTVSNLLNQIIEAAEAAGGPDTEAAALVEKQRIKYVASLCPLCRDPSNGQYCPDCQKTIERGYQISMLSGRCRAGSDYSGSVWHARLLDENTVNYTATCGREPQGLSGGWSYWYPDDRQVTCSRCLKKMAKSQESELWKSKNVQSVKHSSNY